jgi:mono/diheme cytochrome c family protein
MTLLIASVLAASTVNSVGAVIAVIVTIGFVWYVVANIRAGRDEIASEIELAPNRKPYYDDEGLEGPRLTKALSSGLILMAVVAVGLPLYWLNEPGRQTGAVENFDQVFINRGEELFATTAEGGFNCAGCHGPEGGGGVAPPFTLTDDDNEFVAQVTWQAPALDTVLLRFSEEEVREILVYGRPGSPMPAWGAEGGGPLTEQQIDELIAYLRSIQITSEEAKAQSEEILRDDLGLSEGAPIDYTDPEVGRAVFNLGLESGAAGGGYSCARCHTKGASFRYGEFAPEDADLSDYIDFEDGSGAFGFSLRSGMVPRQFLSIDDLIDFLHRGSEFGILYGQRGVGSGRMPGFGDNPNTEEEPADGMFNDGMLRAVALYEASLGDDAAEAGDEAEPTTTTTAAAAATTTTQEP